MTRRYTGSPVCAGGAGGPAPNPLRAMDESWRKATITVTAVAAFEFVLLAGAAVALLGNPLAHHLTPGTAAAAAPRPRATARPTASQARLSRRETAVIVLNGNGRSGAAGAAAARVRRHG